MAIKKIKAKKVEALRFIRDREFVTVHDLMDRFGYKYKGALKRLRTLREEGLITQWTDWGQWTLTQAGERRLDYYENKEKSKASSS